MANLAEFLLARIAEDEAAARAASGGTVQGSPGTWTPADTGDEWEVAPSDDPDEVLELLVALRHGLPRPPEPLSGYWGVRAVWTPQGYQDRASDNLSAASHMARWDPARVLAECEAKRQIVDIMQYEYVGDDVLEWMVSPYADHPDYQQEWKP